MKLVTAVVQDEDAQRVLDALVKEGFRATKVSSTGGLLRRGSATIKVGVDDDQVDRGIVVVRANVTPRSTAAVTGQPARMLEEPHPVGAMHVEVGGAFIFVQNVEQTVRV